MGTLIGEMVVGGPRYSEDQWWDVVGRGDAVGERDVRLPDGSLINVQFAWHPEVVTGRRLVLVVILHSSRGGSTRVLRGDGDGAHGGDVKLSPRETQIVELVALGNSGPEIADELQIAHHTVRTHVRNAMSKASARSRAELVAKTLGNGHVPAAK